MPATYEPIATTTLSSAASTITFNSIGSTYTDLRLVLVGKGAGAETTLKINFNNDTNTLYSNTILWGDGSSAQSSRDTGQSSVNAYHSIASSSQNISFATIDVFSYAGSTNKTCLVTGSKDNNGSGQVSRTVGLYRSTSAITRIDLSIAFSNQFASGTTATLFGIKAA